jgi:hypothetical protein
MLTASRNPVTIWGPGAEGTTTINWNTGDLAVNGRVFMTITENGIMGPETVFDGNTPTGAVGGSKLLSVRFGSSYRLQLRRVNDNAVMDSMTVTVERIASPVIVDHVSYADLIDRLNAKQAITHLRVRAGIDTCHVRFKTAQPTIPFVEAVAPDGTQVGASFPLFGGLRTEHEMLLGEVNALPQATEIKLRIVAAGHNAFGQARESVVNTTFKTGSRHATIDFTMIEVRNDGDPGLKGAGDFLWQFGAGDADNGARMGEPWPTLRRDADSGERVPIRKQINIAFAPRNLAVAAAGTDEDSSILLAPGLPIVGFGLHPEGTGEVTAAEMDHAWVARRFDIAELGDGTVIPLELATGNFAVAFTVRGRITINTTPGRSPAHFSVKDWIKAGNLAPIVNAG